MNVKTLILDFMKKKTEAVKKTVKAVKESITPHVDSEKVAAFAEYLTRENPLWYKTISYSCNTVIDQYFKRYAPDWKPTKPEHKEMLKALAAIDPNFK